MTQNLRQLGATELACSAGAVRELRQAQPLALVPRVGLGHIHGVECNGRAARRNQRLPRGRRLGLRAALTQAAAQGRCA